MTDYMTTFFRTKGSFMLHQTIAFGRLVRCRNCGHLARGPNYCEMCGSLLVVRSTASSVRFLAAAATALVLLALLSGLIAAALQAPPDVSAVCMAAGHNCSKVETHAVWR